MLKKLNVFRLAYSIGFAVTAAFISGFVNFSSIATTAVSIFLFAWLFQWYVLDFMFRHMDRKYAERFLFVMMLVSGVVLLFAAYLLLSFDWLQDLETLVQDFTNRQTMFIVAAMVFTGCDCYRRA